jgi:acyl carrier protein phosphodiesterase
MATRLSRNGDVMCAGLEDVKAHYDALSTGFHAFFPELITYAGDLREQLVRAQPVNSER